MLVYLQSVQKIFLQKFAAQGILFKFEIWLLLDGG